MCFRPFCDGRYIIKILEKWPCLYYNSRIYGVYAVTVDHEQQYCTRYNTCCGIIEDRVTSISETLMYRLRRLLRRDNTNDGSLSSLVPRPPGLGSRPPSPCAIVGKGFLAVVICVLCFGKRLLFLQYLCTQVVCAAPSQRLTCCCTPV